MLLKQQRYLHALAQTLVHTSVMLLDKCLWYSDTVTECMFFQLALHNLETNLNKLRQHNYKKLLLKVHGQACTMHWTHEPMYTKLLLGKQKERDNLWHLGVEMGWPNEKGS